MFLGVLIVIKDDVDIVGEVMIYGSVGYGLVVMFDVEVVCWLCVVGVVIIGKINVFELMIMFFIELLVFGVIWNLWCFN